MSERLVFDFCVECREATARRVAADATPTGVCPHGGGESIEFVPAVTVVPERQPQGAVVFDDAAVERVGRLLMAEPMDRIKCEPYTVARALLAAAARQ